MHSIRVHRVITLIINFFYLIGIWHRGDKPTTRELRVKWFYSIYYLLFSLSLVAGAITNERKDESIFLAELSIESVVLAIKFWLLIWKQNEILDWLNRVCIFSIRNDDDYNNFNDKLRGFPKFVVAFLLTVTVAGSSATAVLPLLQSDKTLFLEIGFPLDWKNNEFAFWIAIIFLFTENILSIVVMIFSTIIWYLLLICSLRYEVLGSELKKMGRINEKRNGKMKRQQMSNNFLADLKASIDAYLHLKKLVDELGAYFSNVFFIRFGTSGLCICGSIYCLAFDIKDDFLGRLVFLLVFFYLIADIFMITYFGNEVSLWSNRVSYCLFESDWIEQPQSTKKCIIIFGEYLKQPQVLLVGKLYPLTLETFTRILNSAYSMFNILKSIQK